MRYHFPLSSLLLMQEGVVEVEEEVVLVLFRNP
jgi:hypothetical protein